MPIKAITCPSCGASGIRIDTAREHSYCSYCGTTLRTRDVLHLDMESMTLGKLKRNAQRSFEVGQYANAKADWQRAIEIDRTDHESYFGLVRCMAAAHPNYYIKDKNYEQALAYAPPDAVERYKQQVGEHNAKVYAKYRAAKDAREAKLQAEKTRLHRIRTALLIAAAVCGAGDAVHFVLGYFLGYFSLGLFVLLIAMAVTALVLFWEVTKKMRMLK